MIREWWGRLRRTRELEALEIGLEETVRRCREAEQELADTEKELKLEWARRIGAEALAGERKAEVERLISELSDARAATERLMSDRLRSLDAVNIRLLEPRVEPPPPDPKIFDDARERLAQVGGVMQAVQRIRNIHHQVDQALVDKFVRGKVGVRVAEPAGVVVGGEGA